VFGTQSYGLRSRFLDEIPPDLLEEPREALFRASALSSGLAVAGARLGHGSAGSVGRGAPVGGGASAPGGSAAGAWPAAGRPERGADAGGAGFRLGEDVVHAAFGEGVVTGVEPDGVIVVRFAGDGSERKLMAEYAPVTRR
jgi:DNA helicase II / ATP-dependent DNA helicase PcrA